MNRYLQHLKERQARQGFDTPAAVLLEIEDIEAQLEQLKKQLQDNEYPLSEIANSRASSTDLENVIPTQKKGIILKGLKFNRSGCAIKEFGIFLALLLLCIFTFRQQTDFPSSTLIASQTSTPTIAVVFVDATEAAEIAATFIASNPTFTATPTPTSIPPEAAHPTEPPAMEAPPLISLPIIIISLLLLLIIVAIISITVWYQVYKANQKTKDTLYDEKAE